MTAFSLAVAAYALFHVATRFTHVPAEVANNGCVSPLGRMSPYSAAPDTARHDSYVKSKAAPMSTKSRGCVKTQGQENMIE